MALGSTQPLTETSTRNLLGGKGRPARKADNPTVICEPTLYKASTSHDLTDLHGLLQVSFTENISWTNRMLLGFGWLRTGTSSGNYFNTAWILEAKKCDGLLQWPWCTRRELSLAWSMGLCFRNPVDNRDVCLLQCQFIHHESLAKSSGIAPEASRYVTHVTAPCAEWTYMSRVC
jgi:hypothetical protein